VISTKKNQSDRTINKDMIIPYSYHHHYSPPCKGSNKQNAQRYCRCG